MNDFKLKNMKTGRVFCINKSVATIGRDTACDVVLALGYPSRFHARITDQEGVLILEDLNSTNGTFVNEQRLTEPTSIKTGDVLKFSTEAFSLLDVGVHDKPVITGRLSSRSLSNKARPNINDTIVR